MKCKSPYVQTRMSKLHKCEFDISKKKHNDKAELNFFCEFPWEKILNSYPNALSKFKTVMVQLDAKWWSYETKHSRMDQEKVVEDSL